MGGVASDLVVVNVDNFARVESERMFAGIAAQIGGTNVWDHNRQPIPLDRQDVIRMNRDTLYSGAIVDISGGATLTMPEAGGRYMTVMAVNQDHYINRVFDEPGAYDLSMADLGTEYVLLGARTLVDASDPDDMAAVNSLQDGLAVDAASSRPFVPMSYDEASREATFDALTALGRGVGGTDRMFGSEAAVDPVRHLIGTAFGWGGLPEDQAYYLNVEPRLPVGEYALTVANVPVDAFWSITVYNEDGFLEPNPQGSYSVNSVMAARNEDGSITVHFGGCDGGRPNCLPITDGWNYLVRLYRARPEVLDGSWVFPSIEPPA